VTVNDEREFPRGSFERQDESDDRSFYSCDRFVSHLDDTALATVEKLIGDLVTEERPEILDLMASWDSHLPPSISPARVAGLGLNSNELARNPMLTERVVHDLNRDPRLPFSDDSFHAVLCTVSVDYLTRPLEVFREVARVLRPGGLFVVIFSNRFFPPKVVRIWREADEAQRVHLVEEYFKRSPEFEACRTFVSQGKPRPAGDRYAGLGVPSDPVYAVFADRKGGPDGRTRRLPATRAEHPTDAPENPRARGIWVAERRRCPFCGEPLNTWEVPQTPFTQWSSTYQLVCFNDDCPHYAGGWSSFARQGNPGSYRFMYDPDSGTCHSMPVPTPTAFRESIVSLEDQP
jgi:SAM-dependent methyltransferase